jgi:hypothetical protein
LIVQGLEGGLEEVGEDGDGDGAGLGLLTALALHEADEGFAGVRDEGKGEAELFYLAGGLAVFEGVKVAFGGAGTGASAAAAGGAGQGLLRHCEGDGRTDVLRCGRGMWQGAGETCRLTLTVDQTYVVVYLSRMKPHVDAQH